MEIYRRLGRVLALTTAVLMGATAGAQSVPTNPAKTDPLVKPAARSAATEPEFKLVVEPRAMDLLKALSNRLAAAHSMSFTAVVGYEYPSKLGPPIVYSTRYDVTMQRPDKLRILTPGDGPSSEFYYDGKKMVAYAPVENLAAIVDAPPTIEGALRAAYETASIYYPFTDLLVADPFKAMTEGVILAFYIGQSSIIGGVKTDMMAWANNEVFLQIWIGADDKLPRRIRAMYRQDPLGLRHEMELSNWQLNAAVVPETFSSVKAQNAPRMAFKAPSLPPKWVKPLSVLEQTPASAGTPAVPAAPAMASTPAKSN